MNTKVTSPGRRGVELGAKVGGTEPTTSRSGQATPDGRKLGTNEGARRTKFKSVPRRDETGLSLCFLSLRMRMCFVVAWLGEGEVICYPC